MSVKYQAEIDGLRAVAVIPVVLFHAGVAGFSGGFVGVDVFFVISGFLITGILAPEMRSGSFSLLQFYERRVRRIAPALLLTLMISLAGGYALFLPYQLSDLASSAINALTFTSNIWFWRHSGYFAGDASLQPLLHSWSLAVEEQFYLGFPLALMLLVRLKRSVEGVSVVLAVSFALAAALVHWMPSATFYLLPTRAWELMLGALLALGAFPKLSSSKVREWAAWIGLIAIVLPVFIYNERTPFPGVAAIPPCVGTFLILWASQSGPSTVTALLARRGLVRIGLISYSLYLLHWPLLVFNRQYWLGSPPAWSVAAVVALSFFAAMLSWRYVEQPFRARTIFAPRQVLRIASVAAVATGLAACSVLSGADYRLGHDTRQLVAARDDRPATLTCLTTEPDATPCMLGAKGSLDFVVWGDSHAAALAEAVEIAARSKSKGGALYGFNACPPVASAASELLSGADQDSCEARNRAVETVLGTRKVPVIILAANWPAYLDRDDQFREELALLIGRLRRTGSRVIVLGPVPAPGYDVPYVASLSSMRGERFRATYPPSPAENVVAELAMASKADFVSLAPAFCDNNICNAMKDGRPLFFDANHVSSFANRHYVEPRIARIFDEKRFPGQLPAASPVARGTATHP